MDRIVICIFVWSSQPLTSETLPILSISLSLVIFCEFGCGDAPNAWRKSLKKERQDKLIPNYKCCANILSLLPKVWICVNFISHIKFITLNCHTALKSAELCCWLLCKDLKFKEKGPKSCFLPFIFSDIWYYWWDRMMV